MKPFGVGGRGGGVGGGGGLGGRSLPHRRVFCLDLLGMFRLVSKCLGFLEWL